MQKIIRAGVSFPSDLLEEFDRIIKRKGYKKRSKAICDAMRLYISTYKWEETKEEVIGVIALIYDHEVRGTTDALTELEHEHGKLIVSTMHIHLDEKNCLELIALKGLAKEIKFLADKLMSVRGVKQLKLLTAVA
ncbi:MAG: nickel-responsive transcriptional regulator NikR [Candidatus Bathyarchaeia archaeon]|nr:nickel-responsive transcriptional regulator NikR [Candidatus Bathyarchaeota archaeon]